MVRTLTSPLGGSSERIENQARHLARDRVLRPLLPHVSDAILGALSGRRLDYDELRSVAVEADAYYPFGESEELTLTRPDASEPLQGKIKDRIGTFSLRQPYVCELQNCRLLGKYPVPLTERGKIPTEAVVRPAVLVRNVLFSGIDLVMDPGTAVDSVRDDTSLDTACLLHNYWNSGYFHWTFESLIRIQGVERYREATGRDVTLVLGPDPPEWQLQTLELLGYEADDWVTWTTRDARVDRLVVPTVRRETVLSPAAVKWLHGRVRDRVTSDEGAPSPDDYPNRIYVSRADADRRDVVNEDEVMSLLEDRGFSRFVLSDLSVPEQAALFIGADVIVAPHGANLTNTAYADDATVIELFRDGDVRGQYFQIAEILGFDYRFHVAEPAGPDMVVDPDELCTLLGDIA
jgi:hypothetical protein